MLMRTGICGAVEKTAKLHKRGGRRDRATIYVGTIVCQVHKHKFHLHSITSGEKAL